MSCLATHPKGSRGTSDFHRIAVACLECAADGSNVQQITLYKPHILIDLVHDSCSMVVVWAVLLMLSQSSVVGLVLRTGAI